MAELDLIAYVILFLMAAGFFLLFDLLWLGVIAKDFYRRQLKGFLADKFNTKWALIFYVTYIVGLLFFAVVPALNEGSPLMALGRGAAFGFFAYATYEFTNAATLKDWPTKLVVADLLWGTLLSFVSAGLTYGLYSGIVA